MSNPNPENQWPAGYCPNPKGRPKDDNSLTGILRRYMDEDLGDGTQRKTEFIKTVVLHAAKGDPAIIKYLWDRLDGLMKQEILMESRVISIVPAPEPQETAQDEQEGAASASDDEKGIQAQGGENG